MPAPDLARLQQAIGKEVRDPDGKSLGVVIELQGDRVVCRHGRSRWFRRTFVIGPEEISSVDEQGVLLIHPVLAYLGPSSPFRGVSPTK
jgi:hypothetical protein